MTLQNLNQLIDATVDPQGQGPLITAPALNILLKNLAAEFSADAVFCFQVGSSYNPAHLHLAELTASQLRELLYNTSNNGNPASYTVSIWTDEAAGHRHQVQIGYDILLHQVVILGVQNEDGAEQENHSAYPITAIDDSNYAKLKAGVVPLAQLPYKAGVNIVIADDGTISTGDVEQVRSYQRIADAITATYVRTYYDDAQQAINGAGPGGTANVYSMAYGARSDDETTVPGVVVPGHSQVVNFYGLNLNTPDANTDVVTILGGLNAQHVINFNNTTIRTGIEYAQGGQGWTISLQNNGYPFDVTLNDLNLLIQGAFTHGLFFRGYGTVRYSGSIIMPAMDRTTLATVNDGSRVAIVNDNGTIEGRGTLVISGNDLATLQPNSPSFDTKVFVVRAPATTTWQGNITVLTDAQVQVAGTLRLSNGVLDARLRDTQKPLFVTQTGTVILDNYSVLVKPNEEAIRADTIVLRGNSVYVGKLVYNNLIDERPQALGGGSAVAVEQNLSSNSTTSVPSVKAVRDALVIDVARQKHIADAITKNYVRTYYPNAQLALNGAGAEGTVNIYSMANGTGTAEPTGNLDGLVFPRVALITNVHGLAINTTDANTDVFTFQGGTHILNANNTTITTNAVLANANHLGQGWTVSSPGNGYRKLTVNNLNIIVNGGNTAGLFFPAEGDYEYSGNITQKMIGNVLFGNLGERFRYGIITRSGTFRGQGNIVSHGVDPTVPTDPATKAVTYAISAGGQMQWEGNIDIYQDAQLELVKDATLVLREGVLNAKERTLDEQNLFVAGTNTTLILENYSVLCRPTEEAIRATTVILRGNSIVVGRITADIVDERPTANNGGPIDDSNYAKLDTLNVFRKENIFTSADGGTTQTLSGASITWSNESGLVGFAYDQNTGGLNVSGGHLMVQDPTEPDHAVNRAYVDNALAGSGVGVVIEQTLDSYSETSVPSVAAVKAAVNSFALNATPVTYDQLVQLRNQAQLVPTAWYLLTDWCLTHTIPGTSATWTGPVEPLFLQAMSPSTLAPVGYSQTYPSDVIQYEINNTSRMPGSTKGYISKRFDRISNNNMEIDFRNVRFRRWLSTQAAPDIGGQVDLYTAWADNGRDYVDMPMFSDFERVRNNSWSGFDQAASSASIFSSINFTCDEVSILRNTTVTNGKVLNVSISSGAWFYNSILQGSSLLNTTVVRTSFFTFLQFNAFCSSIDGKRVMDSQTGGTLLNSGLANQPIKDKTFIAGAEFVKGGVPTVNNTLEFVFNAGFADEFTTTVSNGQAGAYTKLALSNVTTAVYQVDGTMVQLPFTLNAGNTLKVVITRQNIGTGAVVALSN